MNDEYIEASDEFLVKFDNALEKSMVEAEEFPDLVIPALRQIRKIYSFASVFEITAGNIVMINNQLIEYDKSFLKIKRSMINILNLPI